ncbi:MAG TPA: hypothetical protein VG245_06450 [Candidatus Dormibacteraeota bacterium]|jgi:hypothetical protein|nr:hypothetical protein [Candidatus Dormibacteraeota bacterium]
MTRKNKILSLNRETVRNLDGSDLRYIAGGTSGDVCGVENAISALKTPATGVVAAGTQAATDAENTATQIISVEIGGCGAPGFTLAVAIRAVQGSC